jgi:Tol biopolymer transport system component
VKKIMSVLSALALFVGLASAASAAGSQNVRVSVSATGEQANGDSDGTSISGTGRWVVFGSDASNLVPGDTNGVSDIFLRDLSTNTITLVSRSSSGQEGNLASSSPVISADGAWVAFSSYANNLVPGDTNGQPDVFVRNLASGETTVVSVNDSGELGNNRSLFPSISGDGSRIAFSSYATNLVPGDSNGAVPDVFLRNLSTGKTQLISQNSAGRQGLGRSGDASISANGQAVAFSSLSGNFAPNDVNREPDIFVRNLLTGRTVLASVNSSGGHATGGVSALPSLSPGGRRVVFQSDASNLVANDATGAGTEDVYLHDLRDGTTRLVSVSSSGAQGDNSSDQASIHGNLVLFQSLADNLIPDDTNSARNIFVHDLLSGTTTVVDVGLSGDLGSYSYDPSMSANGSRIAFTSFDGDLVPNDTNGRFDTFVAIRPTL